MSVNTLIRPAAGGLMRPGHDPRPCLNNPPQWWDVGDDGNKAAMWLCRTRCPFNNDTCEITPGTVRRGTPYNDLSKPARVCDACGHPRIRTVVRGPLTCKCPKSGRTRNEIVQEWLAAGGTTRPVKDIAAEIGMNYEALKTALRQARKSGDRRAPLLPRDPAEVTS